ncbi:MAG: choice-of-anchor J domain-containing protein [Firmicutes bacterium]|nr:choice-of-anchor J domain-containing protein [Bacillota bacterium]
MTAFKRSCALFLAVIMLLAAIPGTVFAAASDNGSTQGSLMETTLDDIASNVAKQVFRGGKDKDDNKIEVDTTEEYDDSDEVEIIVVVDDQVAAPGVEAQVDALLRSQDDAASAISTMAMGGRALEPERQYTTLLNGFSAKVTYGDYKKIRDLDCVESVFLSPTFELLPDTANSDKMIGGGVYNDTGFNGEGMLIAILDTGVQVNHPIFKDAPTNPSMTKESLQAILDKYDLNAEKDVSSLSAESLYYSAKVPFQFDYGEGKLDKTNGTRGDHGTHVASTAAGNTGVNADAMGVAPQAQILNMNVFFEKGGASFANILAALEDCIFLGVDVANMSLGSDCGFIDYDSEDEFTQNILKVFQRCGENGVSLAVAAGNAYSAAYGNAFGAKALATNPDYGVVGDPSTWGESMSVASVNNSMMKGPYITAGGENYAYYDSAIIEGASSDAIAFRTLANKGELEYVVIPGDGNEEDYEGLDVNGKIALVQRGGIYYEKKMENAARAGAIGMLCYNNTEGMFYMSIAKWSIPAVFISQATGEALKKLENKTITVAKADGAVASPIYGMSDFSSWGTTGELTIKPEITAPGGGIYAAVPGGSYESMDGTSMASPHAAGAMAIVQQALKKSNPDMSAADRKHMTDTLLMSTAHIIYGEGGVPVSPRKQGAGLISIHDAVSTKAYLSVSGQMKPKLELKDDPDMTGKYTMTFTVHNTGDTTLYYDITPWVLTDGSTEYTNAEGKTYTTSSETAVVLDHTFTTNCADNRVAVAAGSTADVTVTVTLTDPAKTLKTFTNGFYVDGFVTLAEVDADGKELPDAIDLSVPFLAFYGDWTKAPIMESDTYWDHLDGSASEAQSYTNTAYLSSSENTVDTYLGDNNYFKIPYLADRNAISPNGDDFLDNLSGIYTGLLRNAKTLHYTITGENGEVYYDNTAEYVGKSIYSYTYYQITPAGTGGEEGTGIAPWYGTDKNGMSLPNNTKATVKIEATLPYADHASNNLKSSWEFPITVDTDQPEAKNLKVTEDEGRYYLSFDVSDNQYVAAYIFYNLSNSSLLYGGDGIGETKPGQTTHVQEVDVTGMGERFGMIVHDYAGNSRTYTVTVPGNTDDYATIKPTNILWTEDFNSAWLPADWSKESKGSSENTWYRDEDYTASVEYDDNNQQDEWLISRTTDISGVNTDVHMVFNFITNYWFTTQYKHSNLLVMASADGGKTWEEIWNLWDNAGLFTDWVPTQAKVTIPAKFQDAKDLRFAFVYRGKGGSNLSIDDVTLYADVRENYVAVTATAGDNGTISPSGETLVKKGTSKTFTITPAAGYQVENVVVDGTNMGPLTSYTFERAGVDHTISATFKVAAAAGEETVFANDFDESLLGEGWTVKKTNGTGKSYNWHQTRNMAMSTATSDKQAAVDPDDYYDTEVGDKQDEWLISPVVDLTGKDATLHFRYGFQQKELYNGKMTYTAEATTDGGKTWSVIWDAKNEPKASSVSYSTQVGTVKLAIPEQFKTANVQIAFHYYKTVAYGAGKVALDDVKLTAPGTAASSDVTLTTSATAGGTVTPAGSTTYAAGTAVTLTFTPDMGHELTGVKVNGRSVTVTDNTYTLTMDQSYFVSATFTEIAAADQIQFENDFESDAFPGHGWTVQGTDTNKDYTWLQGVYYYWKNLGNTTNHAYIKGDWKGGKQNEWLISPAVDLTGSKTRTLTFDYCYGIGGIRYKDNTVTVEISADGGSTWTSLWDMYSTYHSTSGNVLDGSATIEIPVEYASKNIQIAFHYVGNTEDAGPVAIDNVKLITTGASGAEHSITATAGQGGSITPDGTVFVKNGLDQTFTITADEGYAIADVTVDGESVGKVSTYTFKAVTEDHTIAATFYQPTEEFTITASADQGGVITPNGTVTVAKGERATFAIAASAGYEISDVIVDGQSVGKVESYTFSDVSANHTIEARFAKAAAKFDNDFESDDFPGGGWTVKSTNTSDKSYSWYQGNQRNLNATKQARVDLDYYDDPWGGWSANGADGDAQPMTNGAKQDELLISPAVDLTGKSATVSFDYLLHRYTILNKYAYFTFEASTDGGNTWTVLWNAADLENVSGMYFKGTAEVEVPETYRTANVQFAFRLKSGSSVYDDDDGMFAIDNVKLVSGPSDPCASGHTLTHHEAVAASCTASGMKEYWSCDVCGKLFADEAATTETTLEALTLAALGHEMTFHEAKAATCTEAGNVAYYSCGRCGKNFSDEAGTTEITDVTIPAEGHKLTHHEAKAATCTETGMKEYWSCDVCGKLFSDAEGISETTEADLVIAALGHTMTHHEAKAATCTEDGTKEYWECSVCGKKFADAEGKTEITDVTVKATGHDFTKEVISAATKRSDATTTERATYWYTCANCGEVSTEKFFYYGDVLPTEPTKPTEPEKPTEPTKPSEPKPTDPEKPTETTKPSETTKPTETTEPAKPTVTPGTGDPANMALMASMAAVALAGAMAMAFVLLKKRKNG